MEYALTVIILNVSLFLTMSSLTEEKLDFKNKKVYIAFLFVVSITILNYELSSELFRVMLNALIFVMTAFLLFRKKLKISIILGISSFILVTVAELLYALISYPIANSLLDYNGNIMLNFVNNIFISLILIFLSKRNWLKRLYSSIVEGTGRITEKQIIFFSLLVLVAFNISSLVFYYYSSNNNNLQSLLILSTILTVINGIIVFSYLKSQNNYLNIYEKYNISLENVREYEAILEKYKITNHENKNQLLTIRNMSKNKVIIKYIDALLNNKIKDDEQLFFEVCRIPDGGLRGLMYSKLLIMKDKEIVFELNVDKKINSSKLNKIEDSLLIDLCKIVGVFIDNAIEAVMELEERFISIELYQEKSTTNISITNNYKGFIDVAAINDPGYTTKKDGSGYGLTLVKDLVGSNNQLDSYVELYEDNFMQTLKIKL
jgi:Signal transduction histidine kinase regulating citrate/malate metabolism